MAFSSSYSVSLSGSPSRVYEELSGSVNYETLLKLSPTCHSVDTEKTEDVVVHFSSAPADFSIESLSSMAQNPPSIEPTSSQDQPDDSSSSQTSYPATRIHYRLIERINMLFGAMTKDIETVGSQTFIPALKLHVYSTIAAGGTVKVCKIRSFIAQQSEDGQSETLISEYIAGETSRMLRSFTEKACRDAHVQHMNEYHKMVQ